MKQVFAAIVLASCFSATAFAQEALFQRETEGFRCVARAHYSVFPKPALWGDTGATVDDAKKLAMKECVRQMGWNANCRLEACYANGQ